MTAFTLKRFAINLKNSFYTVYFLLLLASCGVDNKEVNDSKVKTDSNYSNALTIDLLIFKNEQVLEVWQNETGGIRKKLSSFQLEKHKNWPYGVFDWTMEPETGIQLIFPSPFYQQKIEIESISHFLNFYNRTIKTELSEANFNELLSLHQGKRLGKLLIFPNKPDSDGHLRPKLNAPHWMAELYALLELELINYQ